MALVRVQPAHPVEDDKQRQTEREPKSFVGEHTARHSRFAATTENAEDRGGRFDLQGDVGDDADR